MAKGLYYGDNLEVLRRDVADASIDLVYLDPPFNSAATYNVLFRAPDGSSSESQLEAFDDTWHWGDASERAYSDVLTNVDHPNAATLLRGIVSALGRNDMTAYLSMMAVRLIELHRVLKPTGSLYLHCDPTASHYLKLVLDGIFGPENFLNEIIWKRSHAHSDAKQGAQHFGRITDTVLFYCRTAKHVFHTQYIPYDEKYVERDYRRVEADGRRYRLDNIQGPGGASNGNPSYEVMGITRYWRYTEKKMSELIKSGRIIQTKPGTVPQYKRYLDEMPGVPLQNLWTDMPGINNRSKELLGYPTQKPLALLERIITASSNPGDIILDPFCGCGTAVHAAEKLGRSWLGIDVTHLAISLIERRLKDAFPAIRFAVHGTPKDIGAARDLAARNKHQFEYWAVSLVDAVPSGGSRADRTAKKGADRGIDGIRWVRTGPRGDDLDRMIVSVKAGENVSVRDVRDLAGTVHREGALGGVLITLHPATRDMLREAASHGMVSTGLGQVRKIMVKTVVELMADVHDEAERLPPLGRQEGFRRAKRERGADTAEQAGLDF